MQPLCTIILASLFISQQLQFSTGVSFFTFFVLDCYHKNTLDKFLEWFDII